MLTSGLHLFSIRGIPVHFSPLFLLLLLFVGFQGVGFVFVGVVTFSILVHEMGHALVAQYFRLSPSIVLHGWGGLCHHERPQRESHDALIIAAGPAAGFALGFLALALYLFAPPTVLEPGSLGTRIVEWLVYINLFWSFINILPLWPLDGGQLFRLGMVKAFGGLRGERIAHGVGTVMGVLVAIGMYQIGFVLFAVISGYWAYLNIQNFNSRSATGAIYVNNRFARELGKKMRAAYEAGQYDEAYRLGRQVRSESNLDSGTLASVWEVLGVVAAVRDNYEEAWSYLKRAPERGRVLEARAACIIALELKPEAQAFIASGKLGRVPEHLQVELRALASLPRG